MLFNPCSVLLQVNLSLSGRLFVFSSYWVNLYRLVQVVLRTSMLFLDIKFQTVLLVTVRFETSDFLYSLSRQREVKVLQLLEYAIQVVNPFRFWFHCVSYNLRENLISQLLRYFLYADISPCNFRSNIWSPVTFLHFAFCTLAKRSDTTHFLSYLPMYPCGKCLSVSLCPFCFVVVSRKVATSVFVALHSSLLWSMFWLQCQAMFCMKWITSEKLFWLRISCSLPLKSLLSRSWSLTMGSYLRMMRYRCFFSTRTVNCTSYFRIPRQPMFILWIAVHFCSRVCINLLSVQRLLFFTNYCSSALSIPLMPFTRWIFLQRWPSIPSRANFGSTILLSSSIAKVQFLRSNRRLCSHLCLLFYCCFFLLSPFFSRFSSRQRRNVTLSYIFYSFPLW